MSLTASLETLPCTFLLLPALPWWTWTVGLAAGRRSHGGHGALLLPGLSPGTRSTAAAGSGQPRQGHETSTNPRCEGPCWPPGATPAPMTETLNPLPWGKAVRAQQ